MRLGDMLMSEHVHEWSWAPYWEGNIVDRALFVCMVKDCDETMSLVEAERRLNATERLSGGEAMSGSYALTGLDDRALHPVAGLLRAYAAALEGEDG